MQAYIKAISYHLPEQVFGNDAFFRLFPTPPEQMKNLLLVGVKERHIAATDELSSDLGQKAAEKLFKEHNISPEEIDFVLFTSQEYDHPFPATACLLQDKLGIPRGAGALDFHLGCSSFVYGLSLAKGLIESAGRRNVLLITSSTLTHVIHEKDKASRFVFGDGAAATLISSRESGPGIRSFVFGTDGKGARRIIAMDGGARYPLSDASYIDYSDEYGNTTNRANMYMDGVGVFLFALRTVPAMIAELLVQENSTVNDIDLFIFHQANLFLIGKIAAKAGIPQEKVFNYMEPVGNTVSATIPIVLAEALKAGRAKPGDKVLVTGFGTGLSWAATIINI